MERRMLRSMILMEGMKMPTTLTCTTSRNKVTITHDSVKVLCSWCGVDPLYHQYLL